MKPFAIILIFLCVAALAGIGYLYMTAELSVTGLGCVASDALDQQEAFQSLMSAVASDTFTGTVFSRPEEQDPSRGGAQGQQPMEYCSRL